MKDVKSNVALDELTKNLKDGKNEEKNSEKVFTKKKRNNIIDEDYKPLKVNYKLIHKERDELHMKEIKKGLNWKSKILVNIFSKTFIKTYKKGIEKGFNSII